MKIHQPKQAKARLRSVMPPRAGKATSTKLYKCRKIKSSSWKIYKPSNGNCCKASGLADQVKTPPIRKQSPGISYKSSKAAAELQALDRSTSPATNMHKPQGQASKCPGEISPSPATNTSKAEIGGGPQGWEGNKLGVSSPGFI
jgi:hypothetical protein